MSEFTTALMPILQDEASTDTERATACSAWDDAYKSGRRTYSLAQYAGGKRSFSEVGSPVAEPATKKLAIALPKADPQLEKLRKIEAHTKRIMLNSEDMANTLELLLRHQKVSTVRLPPLYSCAR